MHRGTRSTISYATHLATGRRVVLKESTVDAASPLALARSEHEFGMAAPIRSDHVVRYLGIERYDHRVAVVEEAFGDTSLAGLLARARLLPEAALQLGVQIARGLVEVHARDVIHRAIHPGNVVVDTAAWSAKIVDFAQASILNQNVDPALLPPAHGIPLLYMSPEQTGRMNRSVDYSTDFYSLGATLYHALSGVPPFDIADPLALVHAHIALPPRRLVEVDPRIPLGASRIVERLLAKNADARYLSARGVAADLEECLRRVQRGASGTEFPLGRRDVPEKFLVPEHLYGRASERAALLDAFHAVARGAKVFFLLGGYAGIGKSSLVHEVQKPIAEQGGVFASGKLDPLRRHAPYAVVAQALQKLCRELLSLPEEELAAWGARILERCGANVGLIADIVPELVRIVGRPPPVPPTGFVEAQLRFERTFAQFVSAFAGEGRPLVLFLDDLQWADPATLHALAAILRLPDPTHLLVVGAYRDNEVGPDHPLARSIDDLRAAGADVRTAHVGELSRRDVHALVADALKQAPEDVQELAEVVVEKTSGNPFFVDQFLRTLHQEHILRFSVERQAWEADLARVRDLGITENVVDLLTRKIGDLPAATRDVLRIGACAGNRFDLDLLAAAAGVGRAETRARVAPAIRERLLVPKEGNYPLGLVDVSNDAPEDAVNYHYEFLHDRVRQAVYDGLSADERWPIHLKLGRILLAQIDQPPRSVRVFDVVDQLNRATNALTDPEERARLAELNREAGELARKTAAYAEALGYVRQGLALLPPDAAESRYASWLALELRYAECAYLAGHFDEAGAFSDALLPRIRTPIEKAELYAIRIPLEASRGRPDRAIELARDGLAALGHPVPEMSTNLPLFVARAKLAVSMGGRRPESLANLPELADARLAAVVKLLEATLTPAFWTDQRLFTWLVHEILVIALRHGVSAATAAGFIDYGNYLITHEHDYKRALAFGQLALSLVEREDAAALRSHVYFVLASTSHAYGGNHLRTCVPLLRRALEQGLESGDRQFSTFATTNLPQIMLMAGDTLDAICDEIRVRERAVRGFALESRLLELRIVRQAMRCLKGETRGRVSLSTEDLDEERLVAEIGGTGGYLLVGVYQMFKTILFTLFDEHEEAVRTILAHDAAIERSQAASVRVTEYAFFACLALARGLQDPGRDRPAMERLLRKWRRRMEEWAESSPMNFRHKERLVAAEVATLEGRHADAARLYDEAARDATANGFVHHAAIASELAARAYARRGRHHIARTHLENARAGYVRWGATGKVRALDEDHPELAPRAFPAERAPDSLDALGVIRASHALSSEIALPALLERIMRVIVQAAGARRGTLLVENDGRLRIEAHFDAERDVLAEGGSAPELVSEAIVRSTLRTGEDAVLADASTEGPFTRDPYVLSHGSRSILCLAVRHRDRVLGVLFLENELVAGAFIEARLEMLRLLVAQAAISLENARLYEATRRLNVELKAQESLLRDFFEGMPVGVYVCDAAGNEVFMNRTASELLGRAFDPGFQFPGSSKVFRAYVAGTDQPYPTERSPLWRAMHGEQSAVDDVEIRRPDRAAPIAVWGTPIFDAGGGVRYAMVVFQDIAQQRAAEAERQRLEAQLRRAERLESLGRLAGGIAHDFNNLLTPMLLYTEIAGDGVQEGSPLHESLSEIRTAAERAAGLTRQLLAFGREQVLERRTVDLNRELREFRHMVRRLVREDIEIDLQLAPSLDPVVADPSQMQRVLMNLTLNAADAMPSGGRVTLESENVFRAPEAGGPGRKGPTGRCVALRVRDTGVGMDPETLAKVFDPFFTTKGPGKGTGLGLPTVYGIVSQHGGHLSVTSAPGAGTTFEVLLPSSAQEIEKHAEEVTEAPEAPAGRGETVLVVDDDTAVRAVVKEVLSREGYRVLTATGPADALAVARALGADLDLVLTDIVMPGMNGRELVAELWRERPTLAALFISGYSEEVASEASLIEGGFGLLRKPLSVAALRAKVRDALAQKARRKRG